MLKIPLRVYIQKQGGNTQSQSQEHARDKRPLEEVPAEKPVADSEPGDGASRPIPEIDEEHIHEIKPVVSGSDLAGNGADASQNTGTAGF